MYKPSKIYGVLSSWMDGDSEPYGAGGFEHGHELAGEVQRHDLVGGANEVAADEDGRDRRRAAEAAGELPLHVAAARVLVQLVHRRAHVELGEEAWHIGQWLRVKITTAFSVDSLDTLSAIAVVSS